MEAIRLRQLRAFLFALAAALYAGTVVELISVKHYQETMQLVPFGLCALGLIAIGIVWRKPVGRTLFAFRLLMLVIAGGSLLGVWEHIEGNYAFAHDIHPRWSTTQILKATFHGRDPLMAPGILAFGSIIAVAATFATVGQEAGAATAPAPAPQTRRWSSQPSLE